MCFYLLHIESRTKERKTKSVRAGLLMPVSRFHKNLRKGKYANRISVSAACYMAAAIEYLCVEIFEGANIVAANAKKHRITPRHISLSIRQDDELNELLKDAIFSEGGVVPLVHKELLMKKSKKSKRETK